MQPVLGASAILVGGLVFLGILAIVMDRVGRNSGGRDWALGWVCLWLSGLCVTLSEVQPWLRPGYPILATAYCALTIAGAARYRGVPVPEWLWGTAISVALLRIVLQPFLTEGATQVLGTAVIALALGFAAGLVWRGARLGNSPKCDRAIAWGTLSIPLVSAAYAYGKVIGAPPTHGLFAWLLGGILLGGIQAGCLLIRLEQASERSRASLEALIGSTPFGLVLCDSRGRVQTVNPVFAKLLGLDDPTAFLGGSLEPLHRRLAQLLHDPSRAIFAALPAKKSPLALEPRELQLEDGRLVVSDVRPVHGRDGEPMGSLWLLADVTEERRLQEQLGRSRRLETLGRLAGGVAHDFNNKLTAVLGNASVLRESFEPTDSRQAMLADLEHAAEYCSNLTQDLLDFAQAAPRARSEVSVRGFLDDLIQTMRPQLPRSLAVRVDVTEPGLRVYADPTQLERVFSNLLLNARDATAGEGRVTIAAHTIDRGRQIEIEIVDDGAGMDAETRDRIFDPFYSRKRTGTGLGLAIVHGIVTGHGGEVRVESEPGQGARFSTSWPAADAV
ncbi:MAG: ATP-binding protein [Myxococcota bacterium]